MGRWGVRGPVSGPRAGSQSGCRLPDNCTRQTLALAVHGGRALGRAFATANERLRFARGLQRIHRAHTRTRLEPNVIPPTAQRTSVPSVSQRPSSCQRPGRRSRPPPQSSHPRSWLCHTLFLSALPNLPSSPLPPSSPHRVLPRDPEPAGAFDSLVLGSAACSPAAALLHCLLPFPFPHRQILPLPLPSPGSFPARQHADASPSQPAIARSTASHAAPQSPGSAQSQNVQR